MTDLFNQLKALCPPPSVPTADIITVVLDTSPIGKRFMLEGDQVSKQAVVSISQGQGMQLYVPDLDVLEQVMLLVAEDSNACITNCGWIPARFNTPFQLLSQGALKDMLLDPESVHDLDGMTAFARLKSHAIISTWQLVDRDVDEHTPAWSQAQDYDTWRITMDQLLPGFSTTACLRVHSSSARVLRDGKPVGGGNGHTWLQIKDTKDVERCRTALLARAWAHDLAWTKPRRCRTTGNIIGQSAATICDPSVWTPGRLVFDGKPVVHPPLTLAPQQVQRYAGEPRLDTARATIDTLTTFRVSLRSGCPMLVQGDSGQVYVETPNLTKATELELAGGALTTVEDALRLLPPGGKLRCQAPFRASSSMAAFLAVGSDGSPFVFDSGTGIKHVLVPAPLSPLTQRIANQMVTRLSSVVTDPDLAPHCVDVNVLERAVRSTYLQQNNTRLVMLKDDGSRVEFSTDTAIKHGVYNTLGKKFLRSGLLEPLVQDPKAYITLMASQAEFFVNGVQAHRQVESLSMHVDMFAKEVSLTVTGNDAEIVLTHRPFIVPAVDRAVINQVWKDFTDHFQEFQALLDMVVHSRFITSTRRRCFIWLHVRSDFGKGLIIAVFQRLGILVDMTVKQIDQALSGAPSGVAPEEFVRALVLSVDEWKHASADLKTLNDSITIAAKQRMRTKVPLYTKLFTSAESVQSLISGGVEQQFNERFSYMDPQAGRLVDRPVHQELGEGLYADALTAAVAEYLNYKVSALQAMGAQAASAESVRWVNEFHDKHLLTDKFGSLNDSLASMADNLKQRVREIINWWGKDQTPRTDLQRAVLACKQGYIAGQHCVQLKPVVFESFMKEYLGTENGKFKYKVDQLIALVDEGGSQKAERKYRIYPSPHGSSETVHGSHGAVVFIKPQESYPEWLR